MLKEASPQCLFENLNDFLYNELGFIQDVHTQIVSHQLDKIGQTIEYLMSNYNDHLDIKRDESISIATAQRVSSEKDWIVSVLERA